MKVGGKHYRSLWPDPAGSAVHIIDQSRLPHVFETVRLQEWEAVADAIRTMRVRGAPLIGVTAAFGLALAALRDPSDAAMDSALKQLRATRPTAINLAWALERMRARLAPLAPADRAATAWDEANAIAEEDVALNEAIGRHGLPLIEREHR